MAAAAWIVPLQLAAAAQEDVASSMGVGARDRQEGGLAAMSQLGLDPSVDEEGVNHGGGGGWWCDAARNLVWGSKDRRVQAGHTQLSQLCG